MLEIKNSGGFVYDGKLIAVQMRCLIADAPARAFVMGHKSHVSKEPCSKFKVRGESYFCKNKQKVKKHMVYAGTSHAARTTEEYINRLDDEHFLPGTSPLYDLIPCLVKNVPFEYMHLVLLGIMKKLLEIWFSSEHKKNLKLRVWFINMANEKCKEISEYCPTEFARNPENISDFQNFKATEFRQVLLVTGIVTFREILPEYDYIHFLMLHAAIRCLVFYPDSLMHLTFAEHALKKFVENSEDVYSPSFMSYNVHGLLHLIEDVKNFGSVDDFSAFFFEKLEGAK